MSTKTEATIEDLYAVPDGAKAEIVNGEIFLMSPTGDAPSSAASEIFVSLHEHGRRTKTGRAYTDNAAFVVNLPGRKSFCPDAILEYCKYWWQNRWDGGLMDSMVGFVAVVQRIQFFHKVTVCYRSRYPNYTQNHAPLPLIPTDRASSCVRGAATRRKLERTLLAIAGVRRLLLC